MSEQNETNSECCPDVIPCPVEAKTLTPLNDERATPCLIAPPATPIIKVPAVLAETTLQIVVEANIPLTHQQVKLKECLKMFF